jgi:hypothetical protein
LYVVQTNISFDYGTTGLIYDINKPVTITEEVNGKHYEHTFTFKVDDSGNITGINDNV